MVDRPGLGILTANAAVDFTAQIQRRLIGPQSSGTSTREWFDHALAR